MTAGRVLPRDPAASRGAVPAASPATLKRVEKMNVLFAEIDQMPGGSMLDIARARKLNDKAQGIKRRLEADGVNLVWGPGGFAQVAP